MKTQPCIRRVPDGRLILWVQTPDQAAHLAYAMSEGINQYRAGVGNPNCIAKGKFQRKGKP